MDCGRNFFHLRTKMKWTVDENEGKCVVKNTLQALFMNVKNGTILLAFDSYVTIC